MPRGGNHIKPLVVAIETLGRVAVGGEEIAEVGEGISKAGEGVSVNGVAGLGGVISLTRSGSASQSPDAPFDCCFPPRVCVFFGGG